MKTNMLETNVTVYKAQFDKYISNKYHNHVVDRLSLDLDAIKFRISYMVKHDKDLDKISELKEEFIEKSSQLRDIFSVFLYDLLTEFIKFPSGCDYSDIIDIFSTDMKMEADTIEFKFMLLSDSIEYLNHVEKVVTEKKVFNMWPDEFFRFSTDSYNDAIAKAYPELFENRHVDTGKGNDGDVFVHNFTFQTTEACSLNCTYCMPAGALIKMADGSELPIEDIYEGMEVLGTEENGPRTLIPSEVTHRFEVDATGLYKFSHHLLKGGSIYLTPEHPVWVCHKGWVEAQDVNAADELLVVNDDGDTPFRVIKNFIIEYLNFESIPVYNLETESHTFIANNLITHNCYQFNKSPMNMKFETAKKFIDELLDDKYGYINRYNSPAIIIEFIGGEPLLQINLTRKIYEYFLDRCYELNHPWFTMHRLSICSNGLQYFDPNVQSFFKDYAHQISFNISIDGNKELHDACRIQPTGEGSYDVAMTALNHYNRVYSNERNSKMTLAPENISYLFDSVVDFINHGMTTINLNCVFEEGWNTETAKIEYEQLKKLASYIINNDLEHLYIAIFRETPEGVMDKYSDGNHCGGLGSMLAMRPNGQFYPCIRYMPTSVGDNVKDLCIGTVQDGMVGRESDSEILDMMDNITRRSQSNDICYDCPIGNSCAWCFKAGTMISTLMGDKPIEEIQIGDIVKTAHGYYPVHNVLSRRASKKETMCIKVDGTLPIYTTAEHPIWVRRVDHVSNGKYIYNDAYWLNARDIAPHDCVKLVDDTWVEVTSVQFLNTEYDVYNLTITENPTYYANGILVHNCSALSHTVYGTPGKRPIFICIQMIAEALANVYYWNLLSIRHPEYALTPRANMVPDEWARLIISENELEMLNNVEIAAVLNYRNNNFIK